MCLMYCAYGNKLDKNGCPTCACKDPCDLVTCTKDQVCVPSKCRQPPCKPPATCVPCPIVDCFFDCPVKFPVDDRGCQTSCECDMCKAAKCSKGQVCINVPGDCKGHPCAPKAKCVDPCTLPKKVGPCDAVVPRYYYDNKTKKCTFFEYGGCEANANNFESKTECEKQCSECPVMVCDKKCTLMKDVEGCDMCECQDPCEDKKCPTGEVCVAKKVYCVRAPCPPIATCVKKCNLPKEPGTCKGFFPRYYYDYKTGLCKKFIYGGCFGNANRFFTLHGCQKECVHGYST